MEKRLHLLETTPVRGTDGNDYTLRGYEHLARLDGATDGLDQWEPTGLSEYRLADGQPVLVDRAGVMRIASSGVVLTRRGAANAPATAGGAKKQRKVAEKLGMR